MIHRKEGDDKTDFAIKGSGKLGEPRFKVGGRMTDFAINISLETHILR